MRIEFRGTVDDYLWDLHIHHVMSVGCSGKLSPLCERSMTDFLRDPAEMGVTHVVRGVLR